MDKRDQIIKFFIDAQLRIYTDSGLARDLGQTPSQINAMIAEINKAIGKCIQVNTLNPSTIAYRLIPAEKPAMINFLEKGGFSHHQKSSEQQQQEAEKKQELELQQMQLQIENLRQEIHARPKKEKRSNIELIINIGSALIAVVSAFVSCHHSSK